jgi:hypothetical protein
LNEQGLPTAFAPIRKPYPECNAHNPNNRKQFHDSERSIPMAAALHDSSPLAAILLGLRLSLNITADGKM